MQTAPAEKDKGKGKEGSKQSKLKNKKKGNGESSSSAGSQQAQKGTSYFILCFIVCACWLVIVAITPSSVLCPLFRKKITRCQLVSEIGVDQA